MTDWPKEDVPDHDSLFMRIHETFCKADGEVPPGAFTDHNGGMSTDWNRYSTPHDTRSSGRSRPDIYGVVGMIAGEVRALPQDVEHSPLPANRAHTDVIGQKTARIRMLLARMARWEISLPPSEVS